LFTLKTIDQNATHAIHAKAAYESLVGAVVIELFYENECDYRSHDRVITHGPMKPCPPNGSGPHGPDAPPNALHQPVGSN
jgi:hypothetical protein